MPRPENSSLLSLFQYNDLNQIICNNGTCNGKVLFKHTTNLQRHLKVLHPSIYISYLEIKKKLDNKNESQVQKRLIELVHKRPVLWKKSRNGANAACQDSNIKIWQEISCLLEIEVDDCKQKWENLKKRFTREFLKLKSESESNHQKLPNNGRLFASLEFLHDEEIPEENSEHNEPTRNIEIDYFDSYPREESNHSCTLYTTNDEDTSTENKINTYVIESNKISAETDAVVDDCFNEKLNKKEFITQLDETENDAEKMFLLSLVPYLGAIPDKRRLMARHRIQGILLEDQQKQIQAHPVIKIEKLNY